MAEPANSSKPATADDASEGDFGLTRRERLTGIGVMLLALLLVVALIVIFWEPAPPRRVLMSTGVEDGAYHAFGKRYREILARSGIDLVVLTSAGSPENLERLRSKKDGVTIALVQGGLAQPGDEVRLQSLGVVAYEPLWLFHRATLGIRQLGDTNGLRVAAGPPGSGTRKVLQTLLERNGVTRIAPPLVGLGGLAAAEALERGVVDVAMFVSSADAAVVRRLLAANNVSLWHMHHADAYVRQLPYLSKIEIPEGAADLARNLPPRATTLLSLKANLVTSVEMHPVMVDLLLNAAREVHGAGGLVNRAGEFPSAESTEYPLSPDAERFYKSGPSTLGRYLPFWMVVWIQRIIYFGLPLLVVGIPLARVMPAVFRWGVRRRIYRWYGELSLLERSVQAAGQPDRGGLLRRLEGIAARINNLRIPMSFASEAYTLRAHVEMVRDRLTRQFDDRPLDAPAIDPERDGASR